MEAGVLSFGDVIGVSLMSRILVSGTTLMKLRRMAIVRVLQFVRCFK